MKRFISFLINIDIVLFILINVFLIIVIPHLISLLPLAENNSVPDEIKALQDSKISFFILSILIIPIVETLLYQTLIIRTTSYLLSKMKYESFSIPIIISGLIFGISHFYNITYLINGIIVGIIFAFSYSILIIRKRNPVFLVALIHSLVNLVPFIRDLF